MLNTYLNAVSTWVNSIFSLLYGFSAGSLAQSFGELWGHPGWSPSQLIGDTFAAMINRLPDGGNFPSGVHDAAVYFGNRLNLIDFILPVDILLGCLLLAFGAKFMLWAFHLIKWITNFVRGVPTERFDGGIWYDTGYSNGY